MELMSSGAAYKPPQGSQTNNAAGHAIWQAWCSSQPECLGYGVHYSIDRSYWASSTYNALICNDPSNNNCGQGEATNGCYVRFTCDANGGAGVPYTYHPPPPSSPPPVPPNTPPAVPPPPAPPDMLNYFMQGGTWTNAVQNTGSAALGQVTLQLEWDIEFEIRMTSVPSSCCITILVLGHEYSGVQAYAPYLGVASSTQIYWGVGSGRTTGNYFALPETLVANTGSG
jgi:hypothetical protein